MTAEIYSTLLIYLGRDFIRCLYWGLFLATEIPVFCRKSVMVRKMHQPEKPRGCNPRPSTGSIIPWCHCMGKLLTEGLDREQIGGLTLVCPLG